MKRLPIWLVAALAAVALGASQVVARPSERNGQIAFDRNSGESLHIIDPDGTDEAKLFDFACCPKWSPDGTRLVVPALTDDGRFTSATLNADGSGLFVLPLDEPGLNADGGVWSPDGRWLAVTAWDDSNSTRNGMYLRRSSGAGRLMLVTRNPYGGRDQYGDFSPDGSAIVFIRHDPARDDAGALFVVNTDGSHLRRITPWGMAGCCIAGWSPDGRWILFDVGGKLYLVQPNGTGLKEIKLHPGGRYDAFEAGWSPDGRRIVFSMYVFRLGQDDIYTADPDGSRLVQVTNTPDHEGQSDWGTHPVVR